MVYGFCVLRVYRLGVQGVRVLGFGLKWSFFHKEGVHRHLGEGRETIFAGSKRRVPMFPLLLITCTSSDPKIEKHRSVNPFDVRRSWLLGIRFLGV